MEGDTTGRTISLTNHQLSYQKMDGPKMDMQPYAVIGFFLRIRWLLHK
jgi:hypothetical protein